MKKLWTLLLCALLLLCAGCAALTGTAPALPGLRINEVVSSNGTSLVNEALGSPDWIELYNGTDEAIDLTGYGLTKSDKDRFRYTFPALTVEPGGYLLVYCCAPRAGVPEGAACSGFKLSREGETLWLSNPSGTLIQQLSVPALETDVSYGVDASGGYGFFSAPTPGAKNAETAAPSLEELSESGGMSGLVLNEVLPRAERFALADGAVSGWVELYNSGNAPIELSAYTITEDQANYDKASLPAGTLQPGEYRVVPFSGGGEDALPFKIGKDEQSLFLFDRFGRQVDSLQWTADILPDVSAGHGEGEETLYYLSPTPGAENGAEGSADGAFPLTEGENPVVLNEILRKNTYSILDADGDRSAWAELYNTSDETVDLSGYALSDDPEDPWKWFFPEGSAIEPHGYVIVYLDGKDRTDGEMHTSFRLGRSDSALTLSSRADRVRQSVPIDPESKDNISYGRSAGGWLYYPQPTPLAPNETKGFTTIAAAGGDARFGVRINEVSAVQAAKSGKSDWVELYNASESDVDLSGWALSDSSSNLEKWPLSGSISAGGYLLVQKPNGQEMTLSASGERLYLSAGGGALADTFDYGALRAGYSSGRSQEEGSEGERKLYASPTPGAKNGGTTYAGYCAAPVFSKNGGYVSEPFFLEMSVPAGQTVYYTTDGSTPGESARRYDGPIELSKTTTVRAVALSEGRLRSDETVATYLFGEQHTLPVVCLSMTQSDLDYVFGSTDRRDVRERQGYVEYYEADGTLGVRFPAGFRIAGNGTRQYAQRSINLYLRGGYGRSKVTYPFFEDYGITEFKSLSLRNMGQDNHITRLRDAYFSMAVKGMNLDYMETRFAVVYLNGKYWGLYEFKENQNEDYLASRHEGVNPDDVMMSRSNTYVYNGHSNQDIKALFALARGNTADEGTFQKYLERADSAYFADYLIAQCFFANSDAYNQKYAGTLDRSLKWRPVYYDLDWAFMGCNPKRTIMSSFFSATGIAVGKEDSQGNRNRVDTALFNGFYKNAGWREQFVERYAEVLNTVLTTENLLARYDAMVAEMEPEMERTIARWGKPSSLSEWKKNVKALRQCIADRRPYAIRELKNFFGLSDARARELFPND